MRTEDADARRTLVFDLHAQGLSHDEIANLVDQRFRHKLPQRYTAKDVAVDLTTQYAEVQDMEGLSRDARRTLMGRRFQMLIEEMLKIVKLGGYDEKIKATSAVIRLMDREASLYGLDEPKKTVTVTADPRDVIERYAREQRLTEDEKRALMMQVEDALREMDEAR